MNEKEELRRSEWAFREAIRRAKEHAWEEGWVAGTELEFNIYTSNPYRDN